MNASKSARDGNDIYVAKHDLRQRTLTARDQLRQSYRESNSHKLTEYADLIGDVNGRVVSGFWPIRSEIDPRPLMETLKGRGARLALPVVLNKNTLEFRTYENEGSLIPVGFGTMGPNENQPVLDPEIMLVPLSVFDHKGGRIGYGAGFYDRAIRKLMEKGTPPVTFGIAFALQEVTKVPQETHDIKLDFILTHEGLIKPDKEV